jgi:hypothetical protein
MAKDPTLIYNTPAICVDKLLDWLVDRMATHRTKVYWI